MDRILHGIIKYRGSFKSRMVEQFKQVKDNPTVRLINYPFLGHKISRAVYLNLNVAYCMSSSHSITINHEVLFVILAKSSIFHLYGQSNATHEIYANQRW